MMKSSRTLFVVCLLGLGWGCGESGMTGSTADSLPSEVSDSQKPDSAAPDTKQEDAATPDVSNKDAGTQDAGTADVGPGSGCEPGEGCFGESCEGNGDCLSGVCAMHVGDYVCSKTCDATCPEGWSCKLVGGVGDGGYACVSDTSHLCLPCATSADCASDESVNACVSYGEEGSFCGAACDASEDCPSGYSCEDVETVDGVSSQQCVANSGVCSCTNLAISSARTTPCHIENEFGLCQGIRACADGGLSDCNALDPAMEICNGVDDNCNGIDDEGTCDDGNSCTVDTCDGASGCTYELIDGGECLDGDPCTVADNCQAGQCVGTPVECKDDNPCTDDTCDGAGGCTFVFNSEPCDDGDACTLVDMCQEGVCAPTVALTCDDNNPCTDDVCSDSGCVHSPLAGACDDGNACTEGDACQNGACLGLSAVFCDDGNICTSDSCSPADGCVSVPNAAPCDDGDLCSLKDTCQDGACALSGVALNCDDENPCTDDVCNPITGCGHLPNAAQCDDADPCTLQDICSAGTCISTKGLDCDDNNPCTTESCVPMAGCKSVANQNPCDDGDICTLQDTCGANQCQAGAGALECNDENPCTDDVCDAKLGCVHTANENLCNDGNSCTKNDICAQGKCQGKGGVACSDGNPCTMDACNPEGGCTHEVMEGPCSDGNACTTGDTCENGVCMPKDELGCDDGNPCTSDSCLNGQCVHPPADGDCDDKNACTPQSVCKLGVCQGSGILDCSDGNPCTNDGCDPSKGCVSVNNEAPCADGDVCTTVDVCEGGLCTGAGGLVCNDNNPCTDDACDAKSGCTFTANEAQCNDGNDCTLNDYCGAGSCVGKSILDCDDGDICTDDACSAEGGCASTPNVAPCDDGDACTQADGCADGECASGELLICDDGLFCTGTETCDPDTGCVTTPPEGLDDGVDCTADACDEETQSFTHTADVSLCGDPGFCNGQPVCDEVQGCIKTPPPELDDNNPCTVDACDEETQTVTHTKDDSLCDDGLACNGEETCTDQGCIAGDAVAVDDGVACTVDACDDETGKVTHTADGALCEPPSDCHTASCDVAEGCTFEVQANCCGNGIIEDGELCDDGNGDSDDGCSSTCQNDCKKVYNGSVAWEQTINETLGGFGGKLNDIDRFGWGIANVGDLDGDGRNELAVGAPEDDDGGGNSGAVWILFLNPNGTVKGYQKISAYYGGGNLPIKSDDRFGMAVAGMGDMNGDGIPDLAVGAPSTDSCGTDAGRIYILFLNSLGMVIGHTSHNQPSCYQHDWFGTSLINVGDVNSDGMDDLLVTSTYEDDYEGDKGSQYLFMMKEGGEILSHHQYHEGRPGMQNGHYYSKASLIPRGDVDGDGVPDFGSYNNSVFLNADGSAKIAVDQHINQGGYGWDNSYQGAHLGDLDGDGVPEMMRIGDGWVDIAYQRRDGTWKDTQNVSGLSGYGGAVDSLGDIDGDGSMEIAVGKKWGGNDNGVKIISLGKGCYTCGNGSEEPGEECDDGNLVPKDGCSATCRDERNWYLEDPHVKYPVQGAKEMYLQKTQNHGDKRYTIESWFKPKPGKDIDCVVCGGQTWKLSKSGDDMLFKYRCGNGGEYKVLTYDTAITDTWHHVAIVGQWEGDRKHTLFVDGIDMGTQKLDCNLYAADHTYGFEIGPGEFYSDTAMMTWGARYQKNFTPLAPLRRPMNVHVWWALEEGAGGIAGDDADKGYMGEIFEGTWKAFGP